jgi:hypothetical protein
MSSIIDPTFWFRGKAIENARHRIAAAGWDLFTAKPHDPYFYPTLPSAKYCGWHGGKCQSEPVWAVMVPLKSANRISTCALGTLEIVANYRARSGSDEIELNFVGARPDESSEIIADTIVVLHDDMNWSWKAISELLSVDVQRVRRLYDFVKGPDASKAKRPKVGAA